MAIPPLLGRSFDTARQVTIGLVDGTEIHGSIAELTPRSPDLTVLETPAGGHGSRKRLVAAERITYIGIHGDGSGASRAGTSGRDTSLKLHLISGQNLTVEVRFFDTQHPLGFYAKPGDPDSPFQELFFYTHAVRAKENAEPIGTMLVKDGVVAAEDVERALREHGAKPRKPLGEILVEQRKVKPEAVQRAVQVQQRRKVRLGELLIEQGLATEEDIQQALREQRRQGRRLGEILVQLGVASEKDIALVLAKKFHMSFVDLEQVTLDARACQAVPIEMIRQYGVLPLAVDEHTLTLAIGDPLDSEPSDVVGKHVRKRIVEVVALPEKLMARVDEWLSRHASRQRSREMDHLLRELDSEAKEAAASSEADDASGEPDSTVIRLTNRVIADAFRMGASDIHIEPNGSQSATRIRFRIDGQCTSFQEVPSSFRKPLVARLKIMAKLDISEKRKPQDGKIRFNLDDRVIELRVATIPTVNGNEDVVMRILAASEPLPLKQMGLTDRNLRELQALATRPYGLLLCVGPTGSGKTTTLHSTLGHINTEGRKIWTAEDPVEITQPGLRQVQVERKIGFTFAAAMRAFLRADPDVIMVGEMRDQETASIGIEASLTGHLVLSTLHTNSAPETITRLIDMGIDPFSFSDALLGVLAQRLARRLCNDCKERHAPSREERQEIAEHLGAAGQPVPEHFQLWHAKGCSECRDTGYRGRIALHELLVCNDAIKSAIQRREQVSTLRELAIQAGMTTLLVDGVHKALAGHTDMKQVLAVCSR